MGRTLPEVPDQPVCKDGPPNHWLRLGVAKGSAAGDVTKAFRKLAAALHPDKNPGDKEALRRFQLISEAYENLGDPDKRRKYELSCADGPRAGHPYGQTQAAPQHMGHAGFANASPGVGGWDGGYAERPQQQPNLAKLGARTVSGKAAAEIAKKAQDWLESGEVGAWGAVGALLAMPFDAAAARLPELARLSRTNSAWRSMWGQTLPPPMRRALEAISMKGGKRGKGPPPPQQRPDDLLADFQPGSTPRRFGIGAQVTYVGGGRYPAGHTQRWPATATLPEEVLSPGDSGMIEEWNPEDEFPYAVFFPVTEVGCRLVEGDLCPWTPPDPEEGVEIDDVVEEGDAECEC